MELHTATGEIAATPPFDFAQSLRFLGLFAPTRCEQALEEMALTKAVGVAGRTVVFRVEAAGTVEDPRLAYTLHAAEPLGPAVEGAARDRIAFYLSLADDLRPFYARAADDPPFAPTVRRLYGYHQVKFPTPFENACWAILSQRTPPVVARRLKDALTAHFGGALTVAGAVRRAFPEAAALAAAGPNCLAALLGNGRKAAFLASAGAAFARADEGWLRTAPYDEVEAWLRRIDGIGPWSATFVLLRGLGRMERIAPASEREFLAAVSRVYGDGKSLTAAEARRIAERYGPWQGYWAHYLRVAG